MNKEKKYYQIMPELVYKDLETISELMAPCMSGFQLDNLKEVLSIISCQIQKSNGTAPLKMSYIKKLVPQGDKYIRGLMDLAIITRTGRALKGVASYRYSFAPEYDSKYIPHPLLNQKLIRRIEAAQEGLRRECAKSVRCHSEQVRYLKQLSIDDNYKELLNSKYAEGTEQYNFILKSAVRIINEDIFYSVDKTSGRFHSNITNMAKGLRPYLRVNGQPLVNIDIKNSQPYLSTILLTNPGKVSWMTENAAFALLLQSLKVSLNQDVDNYIKLVVEGRLYEYLQGQFAGAGLGLNRDEVKRQVLRILFARNRKPKNEVNRKCREVFTSCFPTVHRIFSKVRGRERGDKFHNFKRFAVLLQRIEAYLMLDVILKRIYKELPGVVAITIHDSIMTGILTNNVAAVHKIMAEELTKFTGFRPQIKIEENKRVIEKIREENNINNQYGATTLVSIN